MFDPYSSRKIIAPYWKNWYLYILTLTEANNQLKISLSFSYSYLATESSSSVIINANFLFFSALYSYVFFSFSKYTAVSVFLWASYVSSAIVVTFGLCIFLSLYS